MNIEVNTICSFERDKVGEQEQVYRQRDRTIVLVPDSFQIFSSSIHSPIYPSIPWTNMYQVFTPGQALLKALVIEQMQVIIFVFMDDLTF